MRLESVERRSALDQRLPAKSKQTPTKLKKKKVLVTKMNKMWVGIYLWSAVLARRASRSAMAAA